MLKDRFLKDIQKYTERSVGERRKVKSKRCETTGSGQIRKKAMKIETPISTLHL
jgi:hypothetical protein